MFLFRFDLHFIAIQFCWLVLLLASPDEFSQQNSRFSYKCDDILAKAQFELHTLNEQRFEISFELLRCCHYEGDFCCCCTVLWGFKLHILAAAGSLKTHIMIENCLKSFTSIKWYKLERTYFSIIDAFLRYILGALMASVLLFEIVAKLDLHFIDESISSRNHTFHGNGRLLQNKLNSLIGNTREPEYMS